MRTFKRMPGTGRRSDRSVIHRRICGRATAPPRRREELSEEGDLPPERSKHVCRSHHQTTDCDARESGIPPDAADHQTRQEQQREQQAKNASPSRRHSRSTKSGRPSSSRSGTRDTPRRCCRSGHTRQDSSCSQGRGARQAHDEPGKLLQKNRRESGNGRPSRTGGTPAAAPGHRRLRDKRPHTLLGPTSGQPSCFHGPQAGRRSR